jgi:TonB family protein
MCAFACAAANAADPAAEKEQSLIKLRASIVKNLSTPCGVKPKQRVELKVLLQDSGYVQGVTLVQSSGAPAFDAALMTAIAGAQPYSLPKDAAARKDLLTLNLKFDAFATPIPPCKP